MTLTVTLPLWLLVLVLLLALTKRAVLINRLIYDPQVLESVAAFARENTMPREVVMEQVVRYAREIVPAFRQRHAYFRLR